MLCAGALCGSCVAPCSPSVGRHRTTRVRPCGALWTLNGHPAQRGRGSMKLTCNLKRLRCYPRELGAGTRLIGCDEAQHLRILRSRAGGDGSGLGRGADYHDGSRTTTTPTPSFPVCTTGLDTGQRSGCTPAGAASASAWGCGAPPGPATEDQLRRGPGRRVRRTWPPGRALAHRPASVSCGRPGQHHLGGLCDRGQCV